MRGYPGGLLKNENLDASIINQFIVFMNNPTTDYSFEISNFRAGGSYTPPEWMSMDKGEFFPIIDKYGQFIHKDWPGKTTSPDDLVQRREKEDADLSEHPGPDGWNGYGGWESGPKLEATGYFRVEKHEDRWWLVDPDGRLFWSHGIDCVRPSNGTTPITDREYLYAGLPDTDSPFAEFYGGGSWAPHNYYEGKTYKTYNFTSSNLLHKYGQNWNQIYAEITHRRLRSWGMNTIANWSSGDIYLMRKTPYVVSIGFGGRKLEGSQGYWGKFRDVFDPSFGTELRKGMSRQKGKSAGDPWCIGYFVDNEIAWGDELSLAVAALLSPPDQPAKRVFIEDLKAKYTTIESLNQVWGTEHASWDALLQNREEPDRKKAYDDLAAFYTKSAEIYFKTCRDAVKEVAPNNLYLGCRFSAVNDRAVAASAKYCDVISYNFYRPAVENVRLPHELDMPTIVGEFHFGALDRGMFHTGLGPVENQEARAKAYATYVSGALQNPWIVGTHWFQYGDQATTGRGDGENYQIGFLDVVDTPYTETIRSCREVGYNMYKSRLGR
ncbi:beta-agarase [Candidatus Poribacteria bacterium]